MKFALNYSPPAADLLRAGKIEIDLFKCPDWPDLVSEAQTLRPVYIHFPLVAGQNNIEKVGLECVAEWQGKTATPYVNTHMAARDCDLANVEDADEAVEVMLRDIRPLVKRFGPHNVIAENVPYPDMYDDKPRIDIEPAVIRRIVERSGCGLLLDLGHARLTAEHMGWDVREYIQQLPAERLREVHITGVGMGQHGRPDDHLPMSETDWALLEWSLDQIRAGRWAQPWVVACEYGGIGPVFDWRSDPEVIANDVPRMVEMIRA